MSEAEAEALCRQLGGERAVERRRARELLRRRVPDLAPLLSPASWRQLLKAAHHALLKDINKLDSKQRSSDDLDKSYSSLLKDIVSEANTHKRYIDCNVILELFNEILQCNRLTRTIGNTYISILNKYILNVQYYLEKISPYQWADLFEVVLEQCINQNIDYLEATRLLVMIVKEGLSRCHMILPIRDNLSSIEKLFTLLQNDKRDSLQENLIEMAILITEDIGPESRLTVCIFTETIIQYVLKFYERTTVGIKTEKKILLFHFLRSTILVHHPKGRTDVDSGCLIADANSWNASLKSIHQLVTAESYVINEHRKKKSYMTVRSDELNVDNEFIKLATEMCHQVFKGGLQFNSDYENITSTSKRSRCDSYYFSSLEQVLNCLPNFFYPWISIIKNYIIKYGTNFIDDENYAILNSLYALLMSDFIDTEHNELYETIISIYEKIVQRDWNKIYEELTLKIWNVVLRKASIQNNISNTCHGVINVLLRIKNFHPPIDGLINFYSDQTMPYSYESVLNLNIVLSDHNFKINDENIRLNLTKWTLKNYSSVKSDELVFLILFKLCLKENIPLNVNTSSITNKGIYENIFEDRESFMLISDFEMNLLAIKEIDETTVHTEYSLYTIWNDIYDLIIKTLSMKISEKITKFKEKKTFNQNILIDIDTTLKFISLFLKHKIIDFDGFKDLTVIITGAMDMINSSISIFFNNSTERSNDKTNFLHDMKRLYDISNYHADIQTFIRDKTYKEILETICMICKENDQTEENLFQSEISEKSDNLYKKLALKIILNYNLERSRYSDKTLQHILNGELYEFNDKNDLYIAIDVIEFITKNFRKDIVPIYGVVNLMQEMCKIVSYDNDATFKLLSVLYNMLNVFKPNDSSTSKENCLIMLQGFLKKCTSHYYAPKTMGLALKCLCSALINCNVTNHRQISYEILLKTLCSNIHSIRIYSCYCISLYISKVSPEKFLELWHILNDMFTLNAADLSNSVKKDEGANRTTAVLHCLASISISSSVCDKKSLSTIIQIANEKNISIILLKKVFSLMAEFIEIPLEMMISNNISFLLTSWYKSHLAIDQFPWSLSKYESLELFIEAYKQTIIPMEFFWIQNNGRKYVIDAIVQNDSVILNNLINEYLSDLLILYLSTVKSENLIGDYVNLKSGLQQQFNQAMPSEDDLKKIIKSKIDDVLYGVILLVYDKVIFQDIEWSGYLPYAIMPILSLEQFNDVIRYLKKLYQGDFITDLCVNNPASIKKIFLKLWSDIESHYTLERKLLSLNQYSLFCNLLPVDTKLNGYIYYFIIKSLLSVIKKYSNHKEYFLLSISACKILYRILKKILPELSHILNNLLPLIVSTLSKFALKDYNKNNNDSLDILKFLLVDMRDCIKDAIQILDPLPKLDIFKNINREMQKDSIMYCSLEEQINNFIRGDIKHRYEGLNLLYEILISNRKDLMQMFNDLKTVRGFSEDCQSSQLHQLSFTLIKIMSYTNDENTCLQACRCLGELGPSNLQTLILKPSSEYNKIINNPLEYFIRTLFNELKELIFNGDQLVMEAMSNGLISILTFKEGMGVLESFNNNTLMKELMLPYLPKKKTYLTCNIKIIAPMFETYLNRTELWYDFDSKKHLEWVVDIVESALKCFSEERCFLSNLIDICRLKASVSEKCFLPLIGLILSIADNNQINIISTHVKMFFNHYYEKTFSSVNKTGIKSLTDDLFVNDYNRNFDRESVDCMLQLVQFIRIQMTSYQSQNKQDILELDYLSIAWAAYLNGSYFMSIFYCEMWCMNVMNGIPPSSSESIMKIPKGEDILKILRMCYQTIGDDDALSGCGFSYYSSPVERRNHFMFTKSYMDALLMHDMSLSNQNSASMSRDPSAKDFAFSLFKSGLYHLTNRYIQSFDSDSLFDDIKYECFWRLGNWNLDVDTHSHTSKDLFCEDSLTSSNSLWSMHQYKCLKRTLERDVSSMNFTLSNHLKEARQYIAKKYSSKALENCQSTYYLAAKCQIIQEIESFIELISEKNCTDMHQNLIKRWSVDNILPFANFKNIEPILSQRVIMFDHVIKNSSNTTLKASIAKLQLKYAELAEFHGWSHASNRWINNASQIVQNLMINADGGESESQKLQCLVTLAEGSAAWNSGHQDVAIHLVKSIIAKGDDIENDLYAKALMMYGSWMVETRQESPPDILNNYLQLSLDVLGSDFNHSNKIDTYLVIARFCDGEYKQMDTYIKSANFVNQINRMKQCQENFESLKEKSTQSATLSKEQRKAMIFNDKQVRLDKVEITNIQEERKQYLRSAIKYYLLTLQNGEKYNHCIFRMISLWLNNPICDLNDFCDESNTPIIQTIPSRKFLPLLPQLGPRMGTGTYNKTFQEHLQSIIKKCVLEHPHHTLPILLALKNSQMDVVENKAETSTSRESGDKGYTKIAKKLLKTIMSEGQGKISNIIKEMDTLSLAMIKLANLKTENKLGKLRIPRTHSLQLLKNLKNVLIPTVNLPVSHDLNYENIPSVISISDEFSLVGGVNAPKKLSCRGSDGNEYNMLLKCDDDIRQDAVMQQVFGVVNNLLDENYQTKQRRLLIRTYKIVVLSHRSGILAWCDGTESFGCLLTGPDSRKGYYSKFRSTDLPARSAREHMALKTKSSNEEKLNTFKMILSKFRPVFHMFFTENFLCPAVWYERKLAYTHSVATSSMTGYILGIGDRHVQNILIDTSTAEVIHIDFGIGFEQGKLQPTPETVPFRLTQNMVAGFGCTGVEGIFKKCCEKTMDVLKSNKETLLTILEVLLCDPLYIWTISGVKKTEDTSGGFEDLCSEEEKVPSSVSEAERVLIRVRSKLESAEFGRTLATSGQVARLIQEATDVINLSRLFHGWQPYL